MKVVAVILLVLTSLRTHAHFGNGRHVQQCHQKNPGRCGQNFKTEKIEATWQRNRQSAEDRGKIERFERM